MAEDAQRNGRKVSKSLENDKDKIIKDVETNVDVMLDEVEKDMYGGSSTISLISRTNNP